MKIYEIQMTYPSGFTQNRFIQPGTDRAGKLQPIGFPSQMTKDGKPYLQVIDSIEQAMEFAKGAYPNRIDEIEVEYSNDIQPIAVHDTEKPLSEELLASRARGVAEFNKNNKGE